MVRLLSFLVPSMSPTWGNGIITRDYPEDGILNDSYSAYLLLYTREPL